MTPSISTAGRGGSLSGHRPRGGKAIEWASLGRRVPARASATVALPGWVERVLARKALQSKDDDLDEQTATTSARSDGTNPIRAIRQRMPSTPARAPKTVQVSTKGWAASRSPDMRNKLVRSEEPIRQ